MVHFCSGPDLAFQVNYDALCRLGTDPLDPLELRNIPFIDGLLYLYRAQGGQDQSGSIGADSRNRDELAEDLPFLLVDKTEQDQGIFPDDLMDEQLAGMLVRQ